jgi:hypothetical protein
MLSLEREGFRFLVANRRSQLLAGWNLTFPLQKGTNWERRSYLPICTRFTSTTRSGPRSRTSPKLLNDGDL